MGFHVFDKNSVYQDIKHTNQVKIQGQLKAIHNYLFIITHPRLDFLHKSYYISIDFLPLNNKKSNLTL